MRPDCGSELPPTQLSDYERLLKSGQTTISGDESGVDRRREWQNTDLVIGRHIYLARPTRRFEPENEKDCVLSTIRARSQRLTLFTFSQ